jgi:Domain of Unknown Function (DUF928)
MNYFLARQLPIAIAVWSILLTCQTIALAQSTNPPKPSPIPYRYPETKKIDNTQTIRGTKIKALRCIPDREDTNKPIELSGDKPCNAERKTETRGLFDRVSLDQSPEPTKPVPLQYQYPKTKKIISISTVRGTRWKAMRAATNRSPIAISPDKQGVTGSDRPTLWFYLPNVGEVGLELKDGEGNFKQVYRYRAKEGKTIDSGIIGIPLATTLQPDRRYQWRLSYRSLAAETKGLSDTFQLTGEVYRLDRAVEEALNRDLSGVTDSEQRIAVYLKHGVWYELLSELFKLRQQQPGNVATRQMLRELLQSPTVQFKDKNLVADLAATEEVVNAAVVATPRSQIGTVGN